MDRDGTNFKYDEVTVCELKNSELQACPDKVDYLVNVPFSEVSSKASTRSHCCESSCCTADVQFALKLISDDSRSDINSFY
uniref:PDGF_2 domain-containing protein n=1 Tax=Macrostomum lignano TaxID=282301 RepID=A0A1I8GAG3_9PLAT